MIYLFIYKHECKFPLSSYSLILEICHTVGNGVVIEYL